MGQKFAVYKSDTGRVRGFLDSDTHSNIPDSSVEITKEKWNELKQENNGVNHWVYDTQLDSFILKTPTPATLEEVKNDKLDLVREKTGQLIDNRFKPFDRENLFVLENKTDINDYHTCMRATKQEVTEAINTIRTACNSLESDINNATEKTTLESIDCSKANLKQIAEW